MIEAQAAISIDQSQLSFNIGMALIPTGTPPLPLGQSFVAGQLLTARFIAPWYRTGCGGAVYVGPYGKRPIKSPRRKVADNCCIETACVPYSCSSAASTSCTAAIK